MQIGKTYSGGEPREKGLSILNYAGADGLSTGPLCKQVGFLNIVNKAQQRS